MNKLRRVLIILTIILVTGIIGGLLGYYYSDTLKSPLFNRDIDKDFRKEYAEEMNITFPEREFDEEIAKARENFEIHVSLKTAFTLINIVIAVILIGMYIKIYREVKSDFTIGLIIIMFALLIYAITSNPFIQSFFSYRSFGMGPFLTIPDIFATIALSTLLYLNLK